MKQFLYPTSRQFPHDEVCEQIVRALHARNFNVPGFEVEFRDYGSGEQKLRCVGSIKSTRLALDLGQHDVAITFHRPQGRLGRFNDIAAVSDVQIPKRFLGVYEDESGPSYCVYVGSDWEADRFSYWRRYNALLDELPRKCVRYTGRSSYARERPVLFSFEEDMREYGPEGDEPVRYKVALVLEEFRDYLRDVVLAAIAGYPAADVVDDVCAEPSPIPVPASTGYFFTCGNGGDARRIDMGRSRQFRSSLDPADRYGLAPNLRLAPLGIRRGPDLPDVAYDGFVWCSRMLTFVGRHFSTFSADVIIKVTPKNARGIYVADHAALEKRRAEISSSIDASRRSFTQEEVNDFTRVRACTIVPLTEYADNYESPIYLINRELDLDEVEVFGTKRTP